ncbi:MAG: hypothetical protein ACJAVK_003413 [Akkermansiaceae bacterium]
MRDRIELAEKKDPDLSMRRQCELLGVARSSVDYQPVAESAEDLHIKRLIDEIYLIDPCLGTRRLKTILAREHGLKVNRKRLQRLRREMGIEAIYCKPRTSIPDDGHRKYPYLLRNLTVERPDQVWCTDITYVPMPGGHAYLCAVMDWHSRKVLGWAVSNTMETRLCLEALDKALTNTGAVPEIFNTDQGCQFTSAEWTGRLKDLGIQLIAILLAATSLASGQSLELQDLRLDGGGRFQLDAFGPTDLVLTLHRIENEGINIIPVGIELSQAGLPRTLTEAVATPQNTGIFRVIARDLITSTFDTGLDGIKDSTERQADLFLDAFDMSDASIANIFDLPSVFSISAGAPRAGAGTIEGAHHGNLYRFPGVAGTGLFFVVISFDSELLLHRYYVVGPYGTILGQGRFGLSDLGPVALPFTGEYLLMVGDLNRPETGSYSFEVTAIPTPDEFAISIGDTIAPDAPAPGAGNIEAPAAYDIYTFTASAGDRVFLDTLSFAGTNSINYRLLDPNGAQLDTQQFNVGDMGTVELPLDGTYTLEVGEARNSSTGTYSIALTAIPDPDIFSIVVGDTISENSPGIGAGNIEVSGAFDQYTFTATAGDSIDIIVGSNTGLGSVGYRLLDPSNNVVASRGFFTSVSNISLPANGTYTLEFGDPDNAATGTYALNVIVRP